MSRRGRRGTIVAVAMGLLGLASILTLLALRDNIVFFHSPSEVYSRGVAAGTRLRVGGLVKPGTVVKTDRTHVAFVIVDTAHEVNVSYVGALPDLFREGQGVVAEGVLTGGAELRADSVLAKHDERYMPREVADALKTQGRWQPQTSEATP